MNFRDDEIEIFLKNKILIRYDNWETKIVTREQEKQVKRMAARIFKKYRIGEVSSYLSIEDLIHEGIIGLLKAQKSFKDQKNVPFGAYAEIKIHGAIMDKVRKSPLIRLPQEKRAQVKALASARQEMDEQNIIPTIDRLSQKLGWDNKKVVETDTLNLSVSSIDEEHQDKH